MFYYSIFDWTYILLLPALIFTLIAQFGVKSAFAKGDSIRTARGITGAAAARKILDDHGLYHISIERVGGHLTDHYDPKAGVIRLSQSVYDSTSAAAVGVAAHEAGHAVQYATDYFPIRVRSAIIPVTKIGSFMAGPMFLIGLLLSTFYMVSPIADGFMVLGIALYAICTLFQLITLPVEFNASKRALAILEGWGTLSVDEHQAAKKVLSAAAMTYVAALATSLLSLLRLMLIFSGRRGRR